MAIQITVASARKHFHELINRLRYGHEHIITTHHNQEAAVLISTEAYARFKQLEKSKTSYDFSDLSGKLSWQGYEMSAKPINASQRAINRLQKVESKTFACLQNTFFQPALLDLC